MNSAGPLGKHTLNHRIDQHDETHAAILAAAGQMFRENGFENAGIGQIMKSIGKTVGGFYNHFDSKSDLFRGIIDDTVSFPIEGDEPENDSAAHCPEEVLDMYLSEFHRDNPGIGCIVPSLSAEIARSNDEVRDAYTAFIKRMYSKMAIGMTPGNGLTRRQRAMAALAMAVGGLLIARAVNDVQMSDEILQATRKAAPRI